MTGLPAGSSIDPNTICPDVTHAGYQGAYATLTPQPGTNYSLATFSLAFGLAGSPTIAAYYDPADLTPFGLSNDSLTQSVGQAATSTYVSSDNASSFEGK